MSKTKSLHHIVFATKYRQPTISESVKRDLFKYIMGILRNRNCYLLRMNGVADHIHMLVYVNPKVALADLVHDIKQASSVWMRANAAFPDFAGWGKGYYACSIGASEADACLNYIINQETHHYGRGFLDEMKELTAAKGLAYHPADWE